MTPTDPKALIMGAICDARDMPTADMVEDVRTLIRQRDEARAALAFVDVRQETELAQLRAVADAAKGEP
jgi:hypothetical protein